jgi:hypothetical protein
VVRGAFPAGRQVVATVIAAFASFVFVAFRPGAVASVASAQTAVTSSAAIAVADALLWGRAMPASDVTAGLPSDQQELLASYRRREAAFKSTLTPPPRATKEEEIVFAQRVGIERVVFSLFDRRDSARIAGMYALDADVGFTQPGFADAMLNNLTQKWLAPYLHLVSGDLKLCVGREAEGRRQLIVARDGGHPLIKVVAEQMLTKKRCFDETEP